MGSLAALQSFYLLGAAMRYAAMNDEGCRSGFERSHSTAAKIPEAASRETARPRRYRYGTTVVRDGSHIAMSGKTTSKPSNTNSKRWNGTVPMTTSLNLPVQML